MKRKKTTLIVLGLMLSLMLGLFAGCSKGEATSKQSENNNLSGTITAAGSTALQPLVEAAAAEFKKKNPEATVNVQGGGSGTGLTQVAQGAVEIGNSDIYANEKSGIDAAALVDHKVAVVGFAVVANEKVKIDNLTRDQLVKIFTGEIKNWKEVGGDDKNIIVINRPKSSGTRATFKKYALDNKEEVEGVALTQDSSGAVHKTIAETDGSIGYLALSYLTSDDAKKGLKMLKLDGVEANKENITSGKYPIWSYEHMYTKGEPTGLTKAFLEYMTSDEVKPIIERLGYIPTADMKVSR
ncbi:phosphate ABC transporter substrate-binding protein [Fonticella tunisiensis]|uniref:Phosphate-binding protein n=1 Tax=Fonticella tunisiensis TaxID=1096341 RepID=A0A4R7KDW0_9CLOT|nr:phosphate ABC transporter substrate-binding protein [Fonticella tunisiensis]TDT51233.1 phosphate ABC transporter substrate-binding protein (PhoT family) [Fonticella tunisiensis]